MIRSSIGTLSVSAQLGTSAPALTQASTHVLVNDFARSATESDFLKRLHGDYSGNASKPFQITDGSDLMDQAKAAAKSIQVHAAMNPKLYMGAAALLLVGLAAWKLRK